MNIVSRLLGVNFVQGRKGSVKPDVIVVHIQEGTMVGTDAWFNNPTSKVSAHFGVSKSGEVWQWVAEEDTAWHAGTVVRPIAAIVQERKGRVPNEYSIGDRKSVV